MIRIALSCAALAAGIPCAEASSIARSSVTAPAMSDARLTSRVYNPDEVVRIDGRAGVQAAITFGADELIENVAIGDSASWQITPNKRANLLFVKPLAAKARTNMTVVTDKRTYFFDLVAGTGVRPLYVLRFTYPDEPAQENHAPQPALTAEEAQVLADAQATRPVDPATLNFAWHKKGSAKVMPARIYDDGQATYLGWPAHAPIPAIQIRDEKGVEGPVNYAVRDDVIVVEGVPTLIVLRSGRDSATLENRAPQRKADTADQSGQPGPQSNPQGE